MSKKLLTPRYRKLKRSVTINNVDVKIQKQLCRLFSDMYNNSVDLPPEVNEIISKHFWEFFLDEN